MQIKFKEIVLAEEYEDNLDDFYDPEDPTRSNAEVRSDDVSEDYSVQYDENLIAFRKTGCTNKAIGNSISLIRPASQRLTRTLFSIGTVFGSGTGKMD